MLLYIHCLLSQFVCLFASVSLKWFVVWGKPFLQAFHLRKNITIRESPQFENELVLEYETKGCDYGGHKRDSAFILCWLSLRSLKIALADIRAHAERRQACWYEYGTEFMSTFRWREKKHKTINTVCEANLCFKAKSIDSIFSLCILGKQSVIVLLWEKKREEKIKDIDKET